MVPKHWKINLEGFPDQGDGDVFTLDGEFLGRWSLDQGVFYTFVPDGSDEHLYYEPNSLMLIDKIVGWHEQRT